MEDIPQYHGKIKVMVISDSNNFIFSLDKKKKYKIKNPENAIQTYGIYFTFGGGPDIYISNKCCSNDYNCVENSGTYNTTESYELNFGKRNFVVSSYEVYQIDYS